MDWTLAIERNRTPLLRIVVMLFAVLGLDPAASMKALGRVSLEHYRHVLALLRPAEWAVRRLIVVVAQGLVLVPPRVAVKTAAVAKTGSRKTRGGRVSFQLFDPRKNFGDFDGFHHYVPTPRIALLDFTFDPRIPMFRGSADQAAVVEDVNAEPLLRRLVAIKAALEDLPRQAQRYLRWKARPFEERRPRLASPLRPGAPPRYSGRGSREVDDILRECHGLFCALPWTPPAADSS